MKITYCSKKDFYDEIHELLQRGIGFSADPDDLVITLTGAY